MPKKSVIRSIGIAGALGAGLAIAGIAAPANALITYYESFPTQTQCIYEQGQLIHQGFKIVFACTHADAGNWYLKYAYRS
jgi:hypothetical protein